MIYKKSWKYILVKDDSCWSYKFLYRIKSLKDFSNISKNDIGGFIRGYYNLSQSGTCWVYNDAEISGKASVSENVQVTENAIIIGNARVSGNAIIKNNAVVSDNAKVCGETKIFEDTIVCGNAKIENRVLTEGIYRK